jgi:hypothetical protein
MTELWVLKYRYLMNLRESLPRRLQAIIHEEGNHPTYFLEKMYGQ